MLQADGISGRRGCVPDVHKQRTQQNHIAKAWRQSPEKILKDVLVVLRCAERRHESVTVDCAEQPAHSSWVLRVYQSHFLGEMVHFRNDLRTYAGNEVWGAR